MTNSMGNETWVDANNRYLEASLLWLRLRLRKLLPPEPVAAPPPPAPPEPTTFWNNLFGKQAREGTKESLLLPAPGQSVNDEDIRKATEERMNAVISSNPPPALVALTERFGLSDFERDTLLLTCAPEFDPALPSLFAHIQGGNRAYATFGLALAAFSDPRWDALAPHRPLRLLHMVEVQPISSVPLTASPLAADERIVNYIKGLNVLDERLAQIMQPSGSRAAASFTPSQEVVAKSILERLGGNGAPPVIQLLGPDATVRFSTAQYVCDSLGRSLYRMDLSTLPATPSEIDKLARLWQRENALLSVALYIEEKESGTASASDGLEPLYRFLSHQPGLVFLGFTEGLLRLRSDTFAFPVERPTAVEQFEAWKNRLAEHSDADSPAVVQRSRALAGQYDLNTSEIDQVFAMAGPAAFDFDWSENDETRPDPLWIASRDLTRPSLDRLAQRLDPKATWDDLVMPAEQLAILKQLPAQVRQRHTVYDEWGFAGRMNRGFGITALFSGESGTGKTMAAEVIANDLHLNLYRIDLSAVVSKYIGETEKNLRKLFDAAEQGGSILFFDEADALFGKRSEVKDSHDRYANIEINYLLQRMEAFSGLAILATNMKSALDLAFMRRLRFAINFPYPGIPERKRMWELVFPPEAPIEGLDYERLSRLNLSGGNIHSIALNAAFEAARDGGVISMPIVLAAVRMEMRKMDKSYSEAEFR